jgi:flagellar biosynthesis protein FliR
MNAAWAEVLSIYVLVFCRIGSVFVLLPGFASARMPVSVRIMLAIAVTFALTPAIANKLSISPSQSSTLETAIPTELMIGLAFGFWCYCFLHAGRFAANVIASVIGLAGIPGQPLEDQDPSSHLATLLSLTVTVMIFASDLHLASLAALIGSYDTMPLYSTPTGEWFALGSIKLIAQTSLLSVQMASPFIVLTVIVNLALGLCGKFTPQLQIYFAALGFTILVSLLALHLLLPGISNLPIQAYAGWLSDSLQ